MDVLRWRPLDGLFCAASDCAARASATTTELVIGERDFFCAGFCHRERLQPGHENGGEFKEIATKAPGVRFSEHLPQPVGVTDVLATLWAALRVPPKTENDSNTGRPIKIVTGSPIERLLA